MKQVIIALIRPNLNLSQKESQAAHLIEHLLASPKRLLEMGVSDDFYAQNVIANGGQVNDFYMIEYFIVRSEFADEMAQMVKTHQDNPYSDRSDFAKVKSALIEELNEDRGEFIEMGEQLSKAIFLPGSPTIRNAWNDLESIAGLSYGETIKIFHKYNTDLALLQLSFDEYNIDKLPIIERNSLCKSKETIELTHPWQSPDSVETTHTVPLPSKVDFLISNLYLRSLTDLRFGLLFDELRHKQGLVYDVSTYLDYDNNTLEIYFSSSQERSDIVTDQIKKTLGKYDQFIKNNLDYIKGRLKFDLELDWGDIQGQYSKIIEAVVSGGYVETPASLIERLDQITVQDLLEFNSLFLGLLNNSVVSIKRSHGKSVMEKKKQNRPPS